MLFAQQRPQLGDIGRDPSGLVHRKHMGNVRLCLCLPSIDIGEGLAGRVPDDVAAGDRFGGPGLEQSIMPGGAAKD